MAAALQVEGDEGEGSERVRGKTYYALGVAAGEAKKFVGSTVTQLCMGRIIILHLESEGYLARAQRPGDSRVRWMKEEQMS